MLERAVVQEFIANAHKRSFAPKHTVIHAGDEPTTLYLILEGSVSVMMEGDDGREIVLAYLTAGHFFGEMCLFPQQQTRTAIIRTRAPTLVAEMGYGQFRQFVNTHPEMMFEVAAQMASRLRDTSQRLGDLTFLDVAGRMARVLLDLTKMPEAVRHAKGTVIRISRQELARLVGCSREMAGRVLSKLVEDGTIATNGRSILIYGVFKPKSLS
jgi:CRP/FNR family cyclic AMP-dependent transcriptional regulator